MNAWSHTRLIGHITAIVFLTFCSLNFASAQITGLYNTGVITSGNPAADSGVDAHYSLLSTPNGTSGTAYVTQQHWPIQSGIWLLDTGTSKWISPAADEARQTDAPGTYTYQTTFSVAGDPTVVGISGKIAADNSVKAVLLNGKIVGTNIGNSFSAFASFTISSGFVTGINTLQFVLVNDGTSANPSGLRVEMTPTQSQPLASGVTGLFSTGFDANNLPLPDSTPDPHYNLAASPKGSALAYVTQQSWPIAAGVWALDNTTSKWISPLVNEGKGTDMPGDYTYQTSFTVTGDTTQVQISGSVYADDSISAILLNGKTVANSLAANFQSPASFSLTSGFVSGTNTLAFVVHNGGSSASPSGFRCQLKVGLPVAMNTIRWNGKDWYLAGNNLPWYNYGTDFGTGGWGKFTNWNVINNAIATMHTQKATVTRWWVFADGRYSPKFVNPATNSAVTGLDSQFFADVDSALKSAHDNNVYLIPCLVDFLMFGGQKSSGGVYGGGHTGLLTDPAIQQSYLDNALKPFLQHVAASPYKNNVLAYDICNEIEFVIGGLGGGGSMTTIAQEQTFLRNCAAYIHQYGGGAYATAGSALDSWVGYMQGTGLDFYQFHWYPMYSGHDLPTYASLNLDRPCIIGEFTTHMGDFTIGSTATHSAQWYLDTIFNRGYAGALGWSNFAVDGQGNWNAFAPVFTNWVNAHAALVGPQ